MRDCPAKARPKGSERLSARSAASHRRCFLACAECSESPLCRSDELGGPRSLALPCLARPSRLPASRPLLSLSCSVEPASPPSYRSTHALAHAQELASLPFAAATAAYNTQKRACGIQALLDMLASGLGVRRRLAMSTPPAFCLRFRRCICAGAICRLLLCRLVAAGANASSFVTCFACLLAAGCGLLASGTAAATRAL